jgi:Zn-dependent protease with chaperone function
MPQMFRRVSGLVFVLLVLYGVCFSLPAEAGIISTKQEISIGMSVAKSLERQYGLVADQELQDRVSRIGASLVAVSDRPDMPYTFKVLNSKDINALATPGGFIYVFKGLTDYMPSDEELAGVLSHEIGHVVKRHTARQIEKSLGAQVLFGVLFGSKGAMLQNLALNAIMAGYSREDEREADQVGFYQAIKAGYNPYSMMMTLQKLDDLDNKGSTGIFSSHPEPEARVGLVRGYIEKLNIRPEVQVSEKGAEVAEGEWKLPAFTATVDNYKPLYRAYFTAGALYQIAQRAEVRADRFFVFNEDGKSIIYYDDAKVLTVTQQDADAYGLSLADLTNQYMAKLYDWAVNKEQKKAV